MRSPVPTFVEDRTANVRIVSGHFDADDRLDFAMCFDRTKIKLFDQSPLGTLVLRREEPLWENLIPPYGGSPYLTSYCRIHVLDLDGNKTDDLIITHSQGTLVLRMLPDGSVARQEYARREGVYLYGDGFQNSVLGDMDRDGDLDLVGLRENGTISRLINEGDGRLSAAKDVGRVTFAPLFNPYDVALAAGDLNGDGFVDLVVSAPSFAYDEMGGVTILLHGNGNGLLLERSRIVHPANYMMNVSAVGDVTGDGKDDLLLLNPANQPRSVLAVYEQGGDGKLKPAVSYPLYDSAGSVRIEDLDGDGRNDLAVLHPDFAALTTYLQRGDGQLDFHQLVYNANNLQRDFNTMSIRDFRGDGCKDVLMASQHYLWADGTGCLPASNADVSASLMLTNGSASLQVENRDAARTAHAVVATLKLEGSPTPAAFPADPEGCTGSAANVSARVYVCRIGTLLPGETRTYTFTYTLKSVTKGRHGVVASARVSAHGDDPEPFNNVDSRRLWAIKRGPTLQLAPPPQSPTGLAPTPTKRTPSPGRTPARPAGRQPQRLSH